MGVLLSSLFSAPTTRIDFSLPSPFLGKANFLKCLQHAKHSCPTACTYENSSEQIYLVTVLGGYTRCFVCLDSSVILPQRGSLQGVGLRPGHLSAVGCPEQTTDSDGNKKASLLLFTCQVHGKAPASTRDLFHCPTLNTMCSFHFGGLVKPPKI